MSMSSLSAKSCVTNAIRRAAMLALATLLLQSSATLAATYCVDAQRGALGNPGRCAPGEGGTWSAPFATIGEALAVAIDGDEVWIAAAHYAEDGLVVPSGVTLSGGFAGTESLPGERPLFGPRSVVTTASPASTATIVLAVDGNATIDRLDVAAATTHAGRGIHLPCVPGEALALSLIDLDITGHETGIDMEWEGNGEPYGCSLAFQGVGLRIGGNVVGIDAGVVEGAGSVSEPELELVLTRSTVHGNEQAGIRVSAEEIWGYENMAVSVSESLFFSNGTGLTTAIGGGTGVTDVDESVFFLNDQAVSVTAIPPYKDEPADREPYSSASFTTFVRRSTFRDNGGGFFSYQDTLTMEQLIEGNFIASSQGPGIFQVNSSHNPSARIIFNWILDNEGPGIDLGPPQPGVGQIARNKISGNQIAIRDETDASMLLGTAPASRNDLSGNEDGCLSYSGGISELLATWNFWGTNDAAEIAACISGYGLVTYDPWYWPASGDPRDGAPRHVEIYPRFSNDPALPDLPHDRPAPGSTFAITAVADTANSDARIGSFGATLRWDPRVVTFTGWQPGAAGFDILCNESDVAQGELRCSGTNVEGAEGTLDLLCASFAADGDVRVPSPIDLDLTSMVSDALSPAPFEDLLPIVIARDDVVRIAPAAVYGDVLANGKPDSGDALVLLSREVGLPIPGESSERVLDRLGDANGDGLANSTDANVVLSYEIGLPVPRPIGEANASDASCGSALAALHAPAPRTSAPITLERGDIALALIADLPRRGPDAGKIVADLWLANRRELPIGSYTIRVEFPEDDFVLESAKGSADGRLGRPVIGPRPPAPDYVALAATDTAGDRRAQVRLARLVFAKKHAGAKLSDIDVRVRAMAQGSPGFEPLDDAVVVEPTIAQRAR